MEEPQDEKPDEIPVWQRKGRQNGGGGGWRAIIVQAIVSAIVTFAMLFTIAPSMLVSHADLDTNINAMNKAIETARAEIKASKDALDKAVAGLPNIVTAQVNSAIGALTNRVTAVESTGNNAREQASIAVSSVKAANDGVDSLVTKIADANSKLDALLKQQTASADSIKELQDDVKALQTASATTTTTTGVSSTGGAAMTTTLNGVTVSIASATPSWYGTQTGTYFNINTNGSAPFYLNVNNATGKPINNLQLLIGIYITKDDYVTPVTFVSGTALTIGGINSPLWILQSNNANIWWFATGVINSAGFGMPFSQGTGLVQYTCTITMSGMTPTPSQQYIIQPSIRIVGFN